MHSTLLHARHLEFMTSHLKTIAHSFLNIFRPVYYIGLEFSQGAIDIKYYPEIYKNCMFGTSLNNPIK